METKWQEDFHGLLQYSHRKTNSCNVLTAFNGFQSLMVKRITSDNNGRILILDLKIICYCLLYYVLIIFYLNNNKQLILSIDFHLIEASGANTKIKMLTVGRLTEFNESYVI